MGQAMEVTRLEVHDGVLYAVVGDWHKSRVILPVPSRKDSPSVAVVEGLNAAVRIYWGSDANGFPTLTVTSRDNQMSFCFDLSSQSWVRIPN